MEAVTLADLYEKQALYEGRVQHMLVKARDLLFDGETLAFDGRKTVIDPSLAERISRALEISPIAFNNLNEGQRKAIVKFEQKQNPDRLLQVIVKDGGICSVHAEKDLFFMPSEVLRAVMDAMPSNVPLTGLHTNCAEQAAGTLACVISCSQTSIEVRVGDGFRAGIQINYPVAGTPLPEIRYVVERIVCCNGMTISDTTDLLDGLRKEISQYTLPREVVYSAITRSIAQGWEKVKLPLQVLQRLQSQPVSDPIEALRGMARRQNLGLAVSESLVRAYHADEMGSNPTRLGVLNAFTRLSTHGGFSPGKRRRLEISAQRIFRTAANQCPVCRSFFGDQN